MDGGWLPDLFLHFEFFERIMEVSRAFIRLRREEINCLVYSVILFIEIVSPKFENGEERFSEGRMLR